MNHSLCGLTGRIVIPRDFDYDEERQGYNRAVQQCPLIINYCGNKMDVANAVNWSRECKVPLRIRSGGHNYEGYSNGDCTLVIDISEMKGISLDQSVNLLKVEAGVTNGQLYEFVALRGYPFPGGTCPTVGVSGYATGGGWGLSCRYFGLGCDSLEEIELINYRGFLIKANRFCNADLFWAYRGAGGGNFGVIVAMTFRLPPKVERITLVEVDYLHVSAAEQAAFLEIWQSWLKTADPRITLISRIYSSENDGLAMLIRGFFYGTPLEAEQILGPFLSLPEADYSLNYVTFLEAVTIIGSSYPPFEKFQSASRFAMRNFSQDEITTLVGLIQERAPGSVYAALSMYALGGKVRDIGIDETAFFYRDADFIIWLETTWEESKYAEDNRNWVDNRFPILAAATTGSYVNFPYNQLPDYLREYYGAHVALLRQVKSRYDPFNVFSFPQGIISSGVMRPRLEAWNDFEIETAQRHASDDAMYRGFRYVRDHRTENHS